jgi:putative sterol carrier protein
VALQIFSPEWVAAFEKELQASEEYAKVAKGWKGAVMLHILAEPSVGFNEDIFVILDLHDGVCRSISLVSQAEADEAEYIISGPYAAWKQVAQKKLGPVKGMMTGRLKLRKGSLGMITRYIKATQCIVDCVAGVDTYFPDAH